MKIVNGEKKTKKKNLMFFILLKKNILFNLSLLSGLPPEHCHDMSQGSPKVKGLRHGQTRSNDKKQNNEIE